MTSINVQPYQVVPTYWECSVCLEENVEGKELRGHPCAIGEDHIYHKECLNEALRIKSDCPLCRVPLSSREVIVESFNSTDLEFNIDFPALLDAPKQYMTKVAEIFPKALVVGMVLSGPSIIVPARALVGLLVGGSASRVVRNLSNAASIEHNLFESDGLKEMVKSRPFIGAVAATALLGSVAAFSSILYSSVPILLAGVAVHHAADKAHENELIDEDAKSVIQTISALTTMALALTNPISSLLSLGIGASVGAAIEAYHAQSNREVQQEA